MSREYPDRPIVGIGVAVLRPGNGVPEVLLVRRGKPPNLGSWALLLGPLFLQERNRRWGQWARRACPRLTGISRWVRLLDQGRWGQ